MGRRNICIGMALAFILFMSSCSSSDETAKSYAGEISYQEVLDYLKINERERVLVDSITALDEYTVFIDASRKYLAKKGTMHEGEDVEQTKEFEDYAAACSKIFRIIDELKLSVNASVAVFEKAYRYSRSRGYE